VSGLVKGLGDGRRIACFTGWGITPVRGGLADSTLMCPFDISGGFVAQEPSSRHKQAIFNEILFITYYLLTVIYESIALLPKPLKETLQI
jgi:hypothetical protein